ncbi:MAG: hypothetical protein HRU72_10205 [Planctomycetia bacterium]|jgi:YHS domain-containing protein|nr:hypothetical protein [Candidatus Brocadia sapporoensis]MCC7240196.1 hypothetical protein [Candidatus Brocadia sp.]MEB2309437.1 hypothetical protein [Candidatus Brocadiaceae bacterium]OQZ03230.1 MAG: hypothetical protein B6D34_08045 [Candidatus Brocadia sp. UTAMX1]QOJ06887.1 MAG: hypothetical protein HRU72_10205 [Planctomycetia bacterium]RZV56738.1 MAG: hypothetical protein EX330_12680 [Candidatus Brocadia sp. BROELEC01]TVL96451.1 MAG: hypothetical protein CV082_06440 [Candidatus Brocadia s
MRRIGYFVSIIGLAFVLMTSYTTKTTLASGCCSTKEASAAEKSDTKCAVCGKAVDKDKGVKVTCEGKTVTLCCDSCAAAFKKDPCKYCDDEKCESRKGHHHEEGHH